MKTAFYEQHGGTEVIRVGELPMPEPGHGEVRIAVRAASLNGFDPMILQGTTELKTPMPMIPLGDCAGDIVALGSGVEDWHVGDRVCPFPFVTGEGMTGETRRGAAAEYICFPATNLMRIPDNVSYVDAACLPIAYGTAHRMMLARARIQSGEKVLILGATGGVGVCALELACRAGCEVIACGSSGWKLDRLKALGAAHVIDTSTQNFEAEIKRLFGKPRMLGGGGVDVVINYIGGDTWVQSLHCLTRNGRLLTCGATAGFDPAEDIRYIWTFELNIIGANGWQPSDQSALLDMVSRGDLKPCIHAIGNLDDVADGIQALMDRTVFGKYVIEPTG